MNKTAHPLLLETRQLSGHISSDRSGFAKGVVNVFPPRLRQGEAWEGTSFLLPEDSMPLLEMAKEVRRWVARERESFDRADSQLSCVIEGHEIVREEEVVGKTKLVWWECQRCGVSAMRWEKDGRVIAVV